MSQVPQSVIPKTCLNQKFISPSVQRLETLARVDVVDQDAAIGSSVERDAQGLESLLPGGIPELLSESQRRSAYFARCMSDILDVPALSRLGHQPPVLG